MRSGEMDIWPEMPIFAEATSIDTPQATVNA